IYEGAGEQILFAGSVLRRSDFSVFLLTDCTLYFASGESLVPVRRPIPHGSAFNRKYLVEQLMLGPQAFDSVIGTEPVFPQGISTEHLIAVDKEGDTAQVNFSGSFLELSRDLSPQKEKLLIYSLVNTLCDTRLIKRVRLYVDGVQPESLAGEVWLPGEFLKNPEMVR
ncbi:MAG: GerMN domain-containing protein, partial [Clostridiales bacterium]|nr:GerMN domain-containing protein [Clostridiales bacterium]